MQKATSLLKYRFLFIFQHYNTYCIFSHIRRHKSWGRLNHNSMFYSLLSTHSNVWQKKKKNFNSWNQTIHCILMQKISLFSLCISVPRGWQRAVWRWSKWTVMSWSHSISHRQKDQCVSRNEEEDGRECLWACFCLGQVCYRKSRPKHYAVYKKSRV